VAYAIPAECRRADHMKAAYVIMAMLAVQRGDAYGSEVCVSYHMLLLSSGMCLRCARYVIPMSEDPAGRWRHYFITAYTDAIRG
jgi:hypothetical protein